ncbi:MAG: PIG-L deacetylase family protein [Pseudomonadales bacterium]
MEIQQIPANVERALSISAHPDDSEFFAGGTLAHLTSNGTEVSLVVATDGAKGGRNIDNVARVRRQEQKNAAAELGIKNIISLAYKDGELTPEDAFRVRLIEIIRQVRPDIIFCHHPQTFYKQYKAISVLGHSDHRATGTALMEAVYPRAGSPNFYPGLGGEPWSPREIWLFDCENPDHTVDITAGFAQKIKALEAHISQLGAGGGLPDAARKVGHFHGNESRPAEVFVRLILRK